MYANSIGLVVLRDPVGSCYGSSLDSGYLAIVRPVKLPTQELLDRLDCLEELPHDLVIDY